MSNAAQPVPATFSGPGIIDDYELSFDPDDKLNGSLYLCIPRHAQRMRTDDWIAGLRAAGLWSDTPAKRVVDEQRQAYKDGLIFVAAIAYRAAPEHIVIARFDHPKFPSDTRRWEAWVDYCDARYERCR